MKNRPENHTKKFTRLLKIIQEIKTIPYQTVDRLLIKLGVCRAQFYKDRNELTNLGFEFSYDRTQKRFVIQKDAYMPVEALSLSERLLLMMAVRQLSASGDYLLTYEGLNAARKLAVDLPQPVRDQALTLFDDMVLKEGFGCSREIMEQIQKAVTESRQLIIHYQAPGSDGPQSFELEPYHIFFRRRALYVEGFSWKDRDIRMFRLNRILSVHGTAMRFTVNSHYRFSARHKNAFSVFPGEQTTHVMVHFRGKARPYIMESLWHHSQKITECSENVILFEADVAEPREVLWWALGWGADAEILEPDWLREEAILTVRNMIARYEMEG